MYKFARIRTSLVGIFELNMPGWNYLPLWLPEWQVCLAVSTIQHQPLIINPTVISLQATVAPWRDMCQKIKQGGNSSYHQVSLPVIMINLNL